MKLACLRCRRALAVYAATGREIPTAGAHAKHLALCKECSRELDWFRAVHRDLEESLPAGQATAGFTDATWARFSASAQPRRSLVAVCALASAACVAVIAVVLLFWNPHTSLPWDAPGRPASTRTQIATNNGTGPVDVQAKPEQPTSRAGSASSKPEQKHSHKPAPIRQQRVRFRHGKQRIAHSKPLKAGAGVQLVSASKPHSGGTQTIAWDQMASWYEYQGDYPSAAAAYSQAARERPTDSLMFNAGRAAECAGEVAQAIEYYARVLKHERAQESPSKPDSPPKKGTGQWNEKRDSA